jgi:hypothetical protein
MEKNKLKNVFSVALVIVIFLLPIIEGTNLGSVLKKSYEEVRTGQTVSFTVLFWNTQDPSLPVKLKTDEIPEDWIVIIRPDKFILSQSKAEKPPYEKGIEYINLQDRIIRATPVEVLVKVPKTAKEGKYELIVNVIGGEEDRDISVLMERNLKFTVNVVRGSIFQDMENSIIEFIGDDFGNRITGMAGVITDNKISFIILSFLILIGIILFTKIIINKRGMDKSHFN